MVRRLLIVYLLTTTLAGCAAQRTEFVPPGVDREELAATIARNGQDTSAEGREPTPESSRVATYAEIAEKVVLGTLYVAGQFAYGIAQSGGPR